MKAERPENDRLKRQRPKSPFIPPHQIESSLRIGRVRRKCYGTRPISLRRASSVCLPVDVVDEDDIEFGLASFHIGDQLLERRAAADREAALAFVRVSLDDFYATLFDIFADLVGLVVGGVLLALGRYANKLRCPVLSPLAALASTSSTWRDACVTSASYQAIISQKITPHQWLVRGSHLWPIVRLAKWPLGTCRRIRCWSGVRDDSPSEWSVLVSGAVEAELRTYRAA